MKDEIVKASAYNGKVRVIAAITTELVNEGVKIHDCAATSAAAFGRMLTGGVLMGSMLKSEDESITLQIDGKGPAKGILVTAISDLSVRGYIVNSKADLPPKENGKLDVSGIVGKDGNLTVIKDMHLKEPYIGKVPIFSGEIAEDLAYYFTVSEQTPSAVGLGVLVDKDLSVKASGGFIIQMMPDSDELTADILMDRLQNMSNITQLIDNGMSASDIIKFIFEGDSVKILDEGIPKYKCNCSMERVERALISIGEKDLTEIYNDCKTEEIKCNFCNKVYYFTHDDIYNLLKK